MLEQNNPEADEPHGFQGYNILFPEKTETLSEKNCAISVEHSKKATSITN